jgi:hypothetical protein
MGIQFDKKISIDGIAVIVVGVSALVWLLNMKSTVDVHTTELLNHQTQIQKMNDTMTAVQINLSVLSAMQQKDDNQNRKSQ